MPDITMCQARCPASDTCKRHADSGTVPSRPWQSYGAFIPGSDGCQSYIGKSWVKALSPAEPTGGDAP